ncbi:amidase [Afipia sp. Root123D2]|uniref:amidase family protein n=1 Tax=Afipia sp. Root123D2 TaxID=1736436 RepID=UPI0006F3D7FA|nr:amidase family protein [Afipia sp. Root123D2]KQW22188.1 amidase [Afipia sp. Root123D2]
MDDLWRRSAQELSSLIAGRKVSAREAVSASLARLDAVNGAINAVIAHRPEDALARADAIDRTIAKGDNAGPLAGVPVTVKVNIDQKGYATTNGVRLLRDNVAQHNSPVVDNLEKAGAIIIGRTNTPAFSYRWFTSNLLHGNTKNPRNPAITPGGSSGGAASAVTAGIGAIAHGTDIAGSIRYPAYACGVHGLRPTVGRIAAFNASLPERPIGAQITAVSGPLARTVGDLRLALKAMSQSDIRDPWWVPVPLEGPAMPRRAALCVSPDGLETVPEVKAAVIDAGKRLERAGWTVEEVTKIPPFDEAAQLQVRLWLGDGYEAMVEAAEKEGDPGALAALRGHASVGKSLDLALFSQTLARRATLVRDWATFLDTYAVIVMPVCAELPFADQLDIKDEASFKRVWRAQMPQIALPFIGMPGLTVSTGMVGTSPVGVQIIAGRYREDLCLAAGEAIEAGGVPPSPIDPVGA